MDYPGRCRAARSCSFPQVHIPSNPAPPPLLPASAAVVSRAETVGPKLMVDSPHGVALRWSGPAMVDGLPWPVQRGSLLFLPAGAHSAEPGPPSPALQVTRFNGELTSAQSVDAHSIELSYRSSARAFAILNRK